MDEIKLHGLKNHWAYACRLECKPQTVVYVVFLINLGPTSKICQLFGQVRIFVIVGVRKKFTICELVITTNAMFRTRDLDR